MGNVFIAIGIIIMILLILLLIWSIDKLLDPDKEE